MKNCREITKKADKANEGFKSESSEMQMVLINAHGDKVIRKMFSKTKEGAGDGFHLGIWDDGELAGGAVCWGIHRGNRNAEVGYWLGHAFTGRGLATRSAKALIEHLFSVEKLHRIEMQCGVENAASRAVAERCGLVNEGVRRESHWITDRFVDHVVYGVLDREWAVRY